MSWLPEDTRHLTDDDSTLASVLNEPWANRHPDTRNEAFTEWLDVSTRIDPEDVCTYCGALATELDHVHPRAAKLIAPHLDVAGLLVPVCVECNQIAKARVFDSVEAKREFIHNRLRRKYRRILTSPAWDDKELNELGPYLRQHVEAAEKTRVLVEFRMAYNCTGTCKGNGDVDS